MTTTITLKKLLHPKRWENRTPAPANTTQGSFVTADKYDLINGAKAFYLQGASVIYMYEGDEDAWLQLPASGATGTFAAGACGEFRSLSAPSGVFTQTATGGSTTTIITNRTIVRSCAGMRIRVIAGAGVGYDSTITSNTIGANAVLTVPVNGVAFDATTQYQIYGGSFWFMNAGTVAVGFSVYDRITNTWTQRSVTGLPTSWGTDGQLVSTIGAAATFATGTATAGASTTLTNGVKTWVTNMWANYQVRITGGTGKGQIRTIASNTGTVLTVSAAWTVTPDATSTYAIEGNDDYMYLLGNNAVTLYRFTVSTNTWATLTPTAARASAMNGGGSANWIDNAEGWGSEAPTAFNQAGTILKQNGRYIYSFKGGNTSTLDVYDIAANTWISNLTYGNQNEAFTTGTSTLDLDGMIYIHKENTGRVFKFDVSKNVLTSLTTNLQPQGAVVTGNKMFILPYTDGGTELLFLYQLAHTSNILQRVLLV